MAMATFICEKCGLENTRCHCPRPLSAPYVPEEQRRAERLAELEREQAANLGGLAILDPRRPGRRRRRPA